MRLAVLTQLKCLLFVCLSTLTFGVIGADAPATSAPLPYNNFSALPAYWSPALSPNGTRIAYIQNLSEPDEVSLLATFDLTTGKAHYLLRSDNEKVKVNWYKWVSNERLVISARYAEKVGNARVYETRLLAMDYDDQGEDPFTVVDWRKLKRRAKSAKGAPQFQDRVIDWLPEDPDHILMSIDAENPGFPSVYKVNVKSGGTEVIEKSKREIRTWMTDRQHNVRIGITLNYRSGEREVLLQDDDEWTTLFAYNAMTGKGEYPVGFSVDPNVLYYRGYKGDFQALFKIDLTTKERTEVYSDEGYDVTGSLIYSPVTNDAIGVRHDGRYYWDERYTELQKGLDGALPDTHNTLVSFSDDENAYILYAESDVKPGTFYLGNRAKGSLGYLFKQYPQIDPTRLSEHNLISYEARDGVEIEAYLTLPKGEGPFPTIIHPHGGPGARDFSGFDYWTAYFTNKGYAVLRPNFRGSEGYGYEFSQSQMKGWGLAMQDDITDAAKWMVEQGYATQDNMCIVGASYGGYAALMAAAKTPDLFQCAVSFAGVSSLKQLVVNSRMFTNTEFVKNQIGDDNDDLVARSPLYKVEKVKTPILLVHGEEDRVVHVNQSRDMAEELEEHDKTFRYVELESGDHSLSIQRNRHLFFKEMDEFLSQHLKQSD